MLHGEALGLLAELVGRDRLPHLLLLLQQREQLERVLLLLPLQQPLHVRRLGVARRLGSGARAEALDLGRDAREARLEHLD